MRLRIDWSVRTCEAVDVRRAPGCADTPACWGSSLEGPHFHSRQDSRLNPLLKFKWLTHLQQCKHSNHFAVSPQKRLFSNHLGARGAVPLASIPSYFFNSAKITPPQSQQRRTYRYPPRPALPHSPPTSRCAACRSSTIPCSSRPSSRPSSIPWRGFRRSWRAPHR